MEKKNIQGMMYEVIQLGESHNTGRKKKQWKLQPPVIERMCVFDMYYGLAR